MSNYSWYFTWRIWAGVALILAAIGLGEISFTHALTASNQEVLEEFLEHRTNAFTTIMEAITSIFNPVNATVLSAVCGLAIYALTRKFHHCIYIWFSVGTAILISNILKHFIAATRPPVEVRLVTETSFSFPSGHTTGATALMFALSMILTRYVNQKGHGRTSIYLWVGFWVIAIAIAISRLYLGAHWMTDVLGGLMVGMAPGLIFADIFDIDSPLSPFAPGRRRHQRRRNPRSHSAHSRSLS